MKKIEKLENALLEIDTLRKVIIEVIKQGGDIEFEWNNTGIVEGPSNGLWRYMESNGAQSFTFHIPPHKQKKK